MGMMLFLPYNLCCISILNHVHADSRLSEAKMKNLFYRGISTLFAAAFLFAGCSVSESSKPDDEPEVTEDALLSVAISTEAETTEIDAAGSIVLTANAKTTGSPSVAYSWTISSGDSSKATLSATTGKSITVTGNNSSATDYTVTVKVTATFENTTKTATFGITIKGVTHTNTISSVSIDGTTQIESDGETTLTATTVTTETTDIVYTWEITSGSDYASLSATSGSSVTLTGNNSDTESAHTVTVKVTATNADWETDCKSATHTIEVLKVGDKVVDAVTAVSITSSAESTTIANNAEVTLGVSTTKTGEPTVTYAWEITSGSDYATLSAATGSSVTLTADNDDYNDHEVTITVTATGTPRSSEYGEETTKTDTITFTVEKTTLSSIEITTGAATTTFEAGDTFDASGIVLSATYSNGTTESSLSPTSVSSPDMSTAGTKTVTVTYTDDYGTATATYTITVTAKPEASFTLTYAGPSSGSDVSVTYSNGTLTATAPSASGTYTWAWYIDLAVQSSTTSTLNVSSLSTRTTPYAIVVVATDSATGVSYTSQYELSVN